MLIAHTPPFARGSFLPPFSNGGSGGILHPGPRAPLSFRPCVRPVR